MKKSLLICTIFVIIASLLSFDACQSKNTADNSNDTLMTRGDFCELLTKEFNIADNEIIDTAFSDVDEDNKHFEAIKKCLPFINYYEDDNGNLLFNSEQTITKEEAVSAIVKCAGLTLADAGLTEDFPYWYIWYDWHSINENYYKEICIADILLNDSFQNNYYSPDALFSLGQTRELIDKIKKIKPQQKITYYFNEIEFEMVSPDKGKSYHYHIPQLKSDYPNYTELNSLILNELPAQVVDKISMGKADAVEGKEFLSKFIYLISVNSDNILIDIFKKGAKWGTDYSKYSHKILQYSLKDYTVTVIEDDRLPNDKWVSIASLYYSFEFSREVFKEGFLLFKNSMLVSVSGEMQSYYTVVPASFSATKGKTNQICLLSNYTDYEEEVYFPDNAYGTAISSYNKKTALAADTTIFVLFPRFNRWNNTYKSDDGEEWYCVITETGEAGFLKSDYIEIGNETTVFHAFDET